LDRSLSFGDGGGLGRSFRGNLDREFGAEEGGLAVTLHYSDFELSTNGMTSTMD
jgi:hypothetical protein